MPARLQSQALGAVAAASQARLCSSVQGEVAIASRNWPGWTDLPLSIRSECFFSSLTAWISEPGLAMRRGRGNWASSRVLVGSGFSGTPAPDLARRRNRPTTRGSPRPRAARPTPLPSVLVRSDCTPRQADMRRARFQNPPSRRRSRRSSRLRGRRAAASSI